MKPQKPYADSTLQNMNKSELINYVRVLEKNYDVAIGFLNQQAENIKNCVPVIRSCDPGELEPLWIDSVLGPDISRFQMMPDSCPYYRASVDFLEKENNDTVQTTNNREQELEYALLCMIAQYCQDEHDKYVTHKWMYAGETAFGILGIEDATPVSEIWRRIEELEESQKSM